MYARIHSCVLKVPNVLDTFCLDPGNPGRDEHQYTIYTYMLCFGADSC